MQEIPKQTRVVIVGGGIMGCSLAYHLAMAGWTDIIVLEKAELTSGSTWHAAGQITRAVSSLTLGKCVDYNLELYSRILQEQTDQSVTWHGCGSIRVAYTQDELDWLKQIMSIGRALEADMEIIDVGQIQKLHPFYNTQGIVAGLHTPDDGHVDPAGATFAFAAAARALGVSVIRRCCVTDIVHLASGEWKVITEGGEITCEHVVNAAGPWARQIGDWNQLQLPMVSMTHHYFVTDTVNEFKSLTEELPVVRDDRLVSGYIRMEQKSGLIGIYEKINPNTVWEDGCPFDSENELFEADYERVMPWLSNAMQRMPIFSQLGIKRVVHGAISHPPDGNPLIGPAPGIQNYWCCCGIQIGISWGPALTRELARWMIHGSADLSMREFDPRRFGSYAKPHWQSIKAKEDYCLRHEIPFPHFNRLAGRPVKPSPLYDVLKQKGAVFEEVYGHERPRWFAPGDIPRNDQYSFKRTPVHEIVGLETQAVRERVGVMDITAFAKIELCGEGASAVLDNLVVSDLPALPGGIALTCMLNRAGRIEIELIVARLEQNRFYLICAAFYEQRLIDHLRFNLNDKLADIINRSDEWGGVAVQGPHSRSVLAACTDAELDAESFKRFTARQIEIAGRKIWALKVSYTGELGWELHGERHALPDIYKSIWEAGQQYGIVNYGSFAMNVMRMEKRFKGASELTNEVTLAEADVAHSANLSKPDFVGRAETLSNIHSRLPWICVYLSVESDGVWDGNGNEAVLQRGRVVGSVTSIVYSHVVGCILAFAYVEPEIVSDATELEVVIGNQPRAARILHKAAY